MKGICSVLARICAPSSVTGISVRTLSAKPPEPSYSSRARGSALPRRPHAAAQVGNTPTSVGLRAGSGNLEEKNSLKTIP